MRILNCDHGGIRTGRSGDLNVEIGYAFGKKVLTHPLAAQFQSLLQFAGADHTEYLQLQVAPAADRTQNGGSINAFFTAGIGDGGALYIFYNISAAPHRKLLGKDAKQFPGKGCGVGHGNGFGAAHGRTQLIF